MGGARPTGYDIKDKQLLVNSEEADLIRLIFQKYLELGCVRKLKEYLDSQSIKTKNWTSKKERVHGGASFGRGILYQILKNPIYAGKVRHKEKIYDGKHKEIISYDLWQRVKERLADGSASEKGKKKPAVSGNCLKGKLFDCEGNFYSPVFTSKGAKQYRYYTNQAFLQDRAIPSGIVRRVPAQDIEALVDNVLQHHLSELTLDQPKPDITRVTIYPGKLKISLSDVEIEVPFEPIQSGRSFVLPNNAPIRDPLDLPVPQLKALVKGTIWRGEHFAGMSMRDIAVREGTDERHVRRLITNSLTII